MQTIGKRLRAAPEPRHASRICTPHQGILVATAAYVCSKTPHHLPAHFDHLETTHRECSAFSSIYPSLLVQTSLLPDRCFPNSSLCFNHAPPPLLHLPRPQDNEQPSLTSLLPRLPPCLLQFRLVPRPRHQHISQVDGNPGRRRLHHRTSSTRLLLTRSTSTPHPHLPHATTLLKKAKPLNKP